ncbi:MAG: TetR family transcriptional regulator [SAR324 cluster bacterium]|nr:TetR family transcriptional regulator [SAR324 cluster bacterium]
MPKRDSVATKGRLLKSGLTEFGNKGFSGARTEKIAKRARCNVRLLYYYFGDKEGLYLACLEKVYSEIRESEYELNLKEMEPKFAIVKLVNFTFDHMLYNPDFVRIVSVENTEGGKFLKKLYKIHGAAISHIENVREVLIRGSCEKIFRENIDPFQLYFSILALSYLHLSNRHTLTVTYSLDLTDKEWLAKRKQHVSDLILSYLLV